jgi:hypothetical protein
MSDKPTVHLIESDDLSPSITLKSGMRFEVKTTQVVDGALQPSQKIAARLCGSTSTCLALVEL